MISRLTQMKTLWLWLLSTVLLSNVAISQTHHIHSIKVAADTQGQALVVSILADKTLKPKDFHLKQPYRWGVDLKDATLSRSLLIDLDNKNTIAGVRLAHRGDKDYRLVVDFGQSPISISSSQKAKNKNLLEYSWVLSPKALKTVSVSKPEAKKQPSSPKTKSAKVAAKESTKPAAKIAESRDLVIIIDAGHGGKDPGALSHIGTKEKHIVLSVAKYLKDLLEPIRGYQVSMTRDNDKYITLGGRKRFAQEKRADLFISIHADAAGNRKAAGASVYIFTDKGASSEIAKFLASSKSKTDAKLADYALGDDQEVDEFMLDFATSATLERSERIGAKLLASLGKVGKLHKKRVESANFAVLKSLEVPSVLVELGFLTNETDSKNLGWKLYRERLAQALFWGVTGYFADQAPKDAYIGQNYTKTLKYRIQKGDTLGTIANNYGVKVRDITKASGITAKQTIKVGAWLSIPSK